METITQTQWNDMMHDLMINQGMSNNDAYRYMKRNYHVSVASLKKLVDGEDHYL